MTCHTRESGSDPMVFGMKAKSLEEIPAVNKYPGVFPKTSPTYLGANRISRTRFILSGVGL